MKFIVTSSTLLKHLQTINGVLNSNNAIPILDNFLFELKKGELNITASDLESTITTIVPVEAKDSGAITIPAKFLIETLKAIPTQPLTFNIDTKNHSVEIASDYGKYKLVGQAADDYPKTPQLDSTSSLEMNSISLAHAIDKTLFATGNDEMRPVMSGVFTQLNENNIVFVATDAHKLVKYSRNDTSSQKASSFILPKKPLNLLKNILAISDVPVKIEYNQTNALFSFNQITLICRLIEGKYPNYDAVIPKENPNKLTIDRQLLLGSIKRVSIFSNKTTHQIRLKLSGSELQLSAEDLDFSSEANERLTCQYDGVDMEIGFNSKFLAEMLGHLESDAVNLEMSALNRAGILTPADTTDEHEEILMLVMPVMLNS